MTENRITGTVKTISTQEKRVCIGEKWFSYEARVENFLRKGGAVSAKLNKDGVITYVEKPQSEGLLPQEGSPKAPYTPKKWNGQNAHHIRRQACLNTAVALFKAGAEHGIKMGEPDEPLPERIITIAERLEKWVLEAKA